jgi:hypothetical protein
MQRLFSWTGNQKETYFNKFNLEQLPSDGHTPLSFFDMMGREIVFGDLCTICHAGLDTKFHIIPHFNYNTPLSQSIHYNYVK